MLEILKKIEEITGLPIIPLESNKKQEQIIYIPNPINDDGIIYNYNLELNIVCNTLQKCEETYNKIRQLINTGDINSLDNVLDIYINGGGTLTSDIGIHRIIYLNIKECR